MIKEKHRLYELFSAAMLEKYISERCQLIAPLSCSSQVSYINPVCQRDRNWFDKVFSGFKKKRNATMPALRSGRRK